MCGIVGFIGNHQAGPVLLDGLAKLEYRGYDSAGIAVRNGSERTVIVKTQGRLSNLQEKTDDGMGIAGTCGIGHTRWATHGAATKQNAHPHTSDDSLNVIGVHNGIIENHQEIRDKLIRNGYVFYSSTDTEAFVKLIDYYYKKYNMGPIDAIAKAMVRVRGSYALEVMFKDYPGEIYAARKDSPMIIGVRDGETFVASDVPALLKYTRQVYYIKNNEMARITAGSVTFYDLNGDVTMNEQKEILWDAESADKCGYEHYMLKEIHEQPKTIRDTLDTFVHDRSISFSEAGVLNELLAATDSVHIVACGSAWHAGLIYKYVIEHLARIPVSVELASEFKYQEPIFSDGALVIAISQSGETADTLEALRLAKEAGVRTLAIVNVPGSSIAREADHVLYTCAGPEISVATTKAYSSQLIVGYLLAIAFAEEHGHITGNERKRYLSELDGLPDKVTRVLEDKQRIQWFANKFASAKDAYFVGRGIDYAIGMEGSLKMKEISYIHSEAYAAGELKHGTISLIEEGTLVLGILSQDSVLEKTQSNMMECKSRGAYLAAITPYGNYQVEDLTDFTVYVPKTEPYFAASLMIIPLQLLGYYLSAAKGLPVDAPRNLAKAVTVS